MSLDGLLKASDVVTLHLPLLPTTKNLIGDREMALMKPGAVLIQASRGGIVDEFALAARLRAGLLGGLAFVQLEDQLASLMGPGEGSQLARRLVSGLGSAEADDQETVHEAPLFAYLHPGRFATIDRSNAFPFPEAMKK